MKKMLSRLVDWIGISEFKRSRARLTQVNRTFAFEMGRPLPPDPRLQPGVIAHLCEDGDVARLLKRLEQLRLLDQAFDVHGARAHRYECVAMDHKEIQSIEKEVGTEIPDQCKRWMARAGKGAGPGYGFRFTPADYVPGALSPQPPARTVEDVTELTDDLLIQFNKEFRGNSTEEPFLDYLFGVRRYRGLLTLCEHGCGWDSHLIVAGPQRGRVLEDTGAMGVTPSGAEGSFRAGSGSSAGHLLPTFFEWLDNRIDYMMTYELPQGQRLRKHREQESKRSRSV